MQNRFETQPFQIVRQINSFSSIGQGATGLRERNDFNNLPNNFFKAGEKSTDKN